MGVDAKALLIAIIVTALSISALVSSGLPFLHTSWAIPVLALAALTIFGFVTLALSAIGAIRKARRRTPDLAAEAPSAEAPVIKGDFFNDNAFLGFLDQLMAATTIEGLLQIIQTQLPPLVGGRQVWMVSDLQQHRAEEATAGARAVTPLTADVQEWTTFPLRVTDKPVGLLGIESSGGLGADLRHAIQRVSAVLARAVTTVGTIEALRQAGLVDLLTGAATRREGLNRLQSEVKRAQRLGSSMAVLMVDLDHFKLVNDRYGHAAGDALLTAIGRTLSATLRASDIRCRWGGEEFLIVLPDTDLARAQVVATHLLHNIAGASVQTASGPVETTASIGLTISRPGETETTNMVARADLALYRAKRQGRSCIRVALGDPTSVPTADDSGASTEPPEPRTPTLPFTDRRNPAGTDRRSVPGPGRRRTDTVQTTETGAKPVDPAENHRQVLTQVK